MSSFQFRRYDLIWMIQQKFIANIPKLLIFGLSKRVNLYDIPRVQYFKFNSETYTTDTMVSLLLDASCVTQFGSSML